MIAINGVSVSVPRESDLLDRSLILELNRISAKKIKSEQELWEEFEQDGPENIQAVFFAYCQKLYTMISQ